MARQQDFATALNLYIGLRQRHENSPPGVRDLLRWMTTDRRPLPDIVSRRRSAVNDQPSAVNGQTTRRVTLT